MNPYDYLKPLVANNESLLSLCCGIGLELEGLDTPSVVAVDLSPEYLVEVKKRCPQAETVLEDALAYTKRQPDNSVDVISIIDGIEHMVKKDGLQLIKEMKRVGRTILLFTPEGFLRNEPHNAWDIEGADHLQLHISGWTQAELEAHGFILIASAEDVSQHGDAYTAKLYRWTHV